MNKTRNKPRRGERELGVIYRDLSGASRASQQVRAEFNRRDPRKTRRAENKAARPCACAVAFPPSAGQGPPQRRGRGSRETSPPAAPKWTRRCPRAVPCSAAPWERRGVLDSNLSGTPRPTAQEPGGPRLAARAWRVRTARLTQTGPSGAPPKGRGPNSSVAAFIHRRFAQKKLAEERTRRTPPPGRYPRPAPAQRRRQAALRRGGGGEAPGTPAQASGPPRPVPQLRRDAEDDRHRAWNKPPRR